MQHENDILSAQLNHFRRRPRPNDTFSSSASSLSSSASSSPTASADTTPLSSHTTSPVSTTLSPASPPASYDIIAPSASPSPPHYHPSSRSLPSTPTKSPTHALAVPSTPLSSLTLPPTSSSPAPSPSQAAVGARWPGVGRMTVSRAAGNTVDKVAGEDKASGKQSEKQQAAEEEAGEQPQRAQSTESSASSPTGPPEALHVRSLPTLNTTYLSASPPLSSSNAAASSSTPSIGRSFSLTSTPHASQTLQRSIPLRSFSRTSILSPLSSSPSPSPPPLPNGSSSVGQSRTSPPVSFDGLTPATTLRTLQPVLTPSSGLSPASSASSTQSDSATSLTPASAMRVLLTGQRDEAGSNKTGTTTRRLSGRVSRESSPQLAPLTEGNLLSVSSLSPASKHHKHSFSLTSPLALPRVSSQDISVIVPTLQRTATTDRMDLTPSAAAAAAMAMAPSSTHTLSVTHSQLHDPNMTHSLADIFNVPQPASPSTLLTADESDSDDEEETAVESGAPSASSEVSVPTQHGLFFHRLLAHLPFTLPPALIRHIETSYAILITLSLFYTLFVDPIRLALLPPSVDLPLTLLLFLIFLLLLLELLFFLVSNPSYSHSLECVLDGLACLSLLPQLYCMWSDRELTRLERAVMMMCRAGVMVRLVGVLRLLGAWEVWEHKVRSKGWESLMRGKWWWQQMQRKWRQRWKHSNDKSAHTDSSINLLRAERDHANDSDDDDSLPPADQQHIIHDGLTSVLYPSHASRIGQLLSDYTAHRVVLGVLFTLILYNYFHPHSVHTVHPYAIAHLDSLLDGHIANITTSSIEHSIQQYIDSYRPELLSLRMDGVTLYEQNATFTQLRRHEKERIVTPHFDVWVNIKPWSQQFALFDFWSLLMVLLLLPVLLCLIYADVHAVVTPIERMCKFVTNLATDPMSEIGGSDATLSSSLQSLLPATASSSLLASSTSSSAAASTLSPSFSLDSFLVELTLQKLAILLQLVFGSAGANIIANNIRGDYLEVITPGRKVYAIFSFLTVEGWDEVMEVLEVEMSELMNCVAELVHSVCVLFGGEVNKNIGNAFLLVWKLEADNNRRAGKEPTEDDDGWTGSERGRLLDSEKGRRQSHHHDERSGSVVPSTSFPHVLNSYLPHAASPVRSTSITDSPPSPRRPSRASSHSQSLSIPHQSPHMRQRKGRPRALPHPAGSSHYPHEPVSPVEFDSPPALVHRNRSEVPTEIVDEVGLKRRNSLLFGVMSLNPRDLSKIFTRSTMNIFGVGDEASRQAEEAVADVAEVKGDGGLMTSMKEEKDQRHDILSELPGKFNTDSHHLPPSADISPSSASFYARTRPAPPLRRSHTWKDSASNHRVAEHALSSFLLTLLQLSTSPALHKWRTHPQLVSHHLSLQFAIGLHAGWAIEGAIGSSHKIDASYLSPNVNLSSRLSMLCHHYRLPLLFSSSFYALLGVEVQKRCRRVDVVSVKGSKKPVGIYTFDVDFGEVDEMERARLEEWLKEGGPASGCAVGSSGTVGGSGSRPAAGAHESYDERMRRRQVKEIDDIMRQLNRITKRKAIRAAAPPSPGSVQSSDDDEEGQPRSRTGRRASAPSVPSAALSRSSSSSNLSSHSPLLPSLPDLLAAVQSHLPPAFIPLYNAACSCYLDGDWRSAGRLLVRVLTLRSGDGPSQLLLKVMAREGFRAPTGWKGYRVLTKK